VNLIYTLFILDLPKKIAIIILNYGNSDDEQNKYRQMAHPKDLPVLTSAIKSRADYLVTFNTKHYFPARGYNLNVLQPGEALQKIRLMLSHLEPINDS
jgi:predicted nucleic acid-binding protein